MNPPNDDEMRSSDLGVGERNVRKVAKYERTTWSLISIVLVLLVVAILVFDRRDRSPSTSDETPPTDHHQMAEVSPHADVASETPKHAKPPSRVKPTLHASAPAKSKKEAKAPPKETIRVEIEPKIPPREAAEPPVPPHDERAPDEPSETDIAPKNPPQTSLQPPTVKLAEAAFLTHPLPDIARGSVAPGRSVTLLEFPRTPEEITLELLGLDWVNTNAAHSEANTRPKLTATYSAEERALYIQDARGPSPQEVATFFMQKGKLRFKWKPRTSLSEIQRALRSHSVLHITWKGHPGRYYALHELHARDARRIRNQQVRLRPDELPPYGDPDNLYLGPGKLEIADIYSHRFLVLPKAKRLELPTITRSRKDPPIFIKLAWHDRSLLLKLDSPVNTDAAAKRRRRLFEHIDGNFHLHASLYRVVDDRVKVEVLRLGSP